MAINFRPFQNLYQHIKQTDTRLFETLDRISLYLSDLYNQTGSKFTSPIVVTLPANFLIPAVNTAVPGFFLTLPQEGWWIIRIDAAIFIDPASFNQYVFIQHNGAIIPGAITTGLTAGAQALSVTCSRSWTINTSRLNDIIQVMVSKVGAGVFDTLTGTAGAPTAVTQMTAIYLGK